MKSISLYRPLWLILLISSAVLSACGSGKSGDDVVCTAEARSSVSLTVLDSLGLPMRAYDVAYQIDKGATQNISCNTSGACAIEYEKNGVFSMTVSKPGFNPTSLDVTVTRDACHVNTQNITLTLKAF